MEPPSALLPNHHHHHTSQSSTQTDHDAFTLHSLDSDTIARITTRLSDQDIGRLWFCGDSNLNWRLVHGGVQIFNFERDCRRGTKLWPRMISKFIGLLEFSFHSTVDADFHGSGRRQNIDKDEVASLPPSLTKLVLIGRLDILKSTTTLLLDRLPNLTHLEMPGSPEWIVEHPTAKTNLNALKLKLPASINGKEDVILPNGLTQVSLQGMSVLGGTFVLPASVMALEVSPVEKTAWGAPSQHRFKLPPELTSLSFITFSQWRKEPHTSFPLLPRTLTRLEIEVDFSKIDLALISALPRGLKRLCALPIQMNHLSTNWETMQALPPTLETLDMGFINITGENDRCPFPPSLTVLKCLKGDINPCWYPPNLRKLALCPIKANEGAAILPSNLTWLSIASFLSQPHSIVLPVNLTALSISVPLFRGTLPLFPAKLTKLHLDMGSVSELPETFPSGLTSLNISFRVMVIEANNWLLKLPWLTLKTLKHSGTVFLSWLRALPPTPALTTLNVRRVPRSSWPERFSYIQPEHLALLPASVTDLMIPVHSPQQKPWSLSCLQHLISLQALTIDTDAPVKAFSEDQPLKSWQRQPQQDPDWNALIPGKLGRLTIIHEYELEQYKNMQLIQQAEAQGITILYTRSISGEPVLDDEGAFD